MYTVKCDNNLLLNKFVQSRMLINPLLRQKANEAGSFSFEITDQHPCYNLIYPLMSRIKVYDNGSLCWLGRAKEINDDGENIKGVACEGCLSFLNDSLVGPYDFEGTPSEFFSFLIESHNSIVKDSQKFVIGECTVTSDTDINRWSSLYEQTFKIIKDKLIDEFGGYLYVTYNSSEQPVINYYQVPPNTCTQLVQFGKNLISYEETLLYDTFYTACVPLGAKLEDSNLRLTIGAVNDGIDYLVNENLAEQYGVRMAPVNLTTWDSVTMPSTLKTNGQNWLDNHGIKHKETVRLSAADISTIQQGVQSFKFLWNVGFKLKTGSAIYYVVTEQELDLNKSANAGLTLGDTKEEYTGLIQQQVGSIVSQVSIIEGDYTTHQESQQIAQTIVETTTQIQLQATAIISQVLESYYTKQQIDDMLVEDVMSLRSQIQQLSDSIQASFEYYNSTVDGISSQVTQISSWVTIVPETPTQSVGIIIGNSESAIKLKLENDKLYFYVGDDSAPVILMWLDEDTLHIQEVEIQRLSIGEQGKMLDFKIVGSGVNTCVYFSGRLVL